MAALRRYGVNEDGGVRIAAELAAKAARSAPLDGRPLFAANLAQPWPDGPLAKLWHAVTLLREQRGDGHVAALVSAGVSGRESNVLHAAAGRVPQQMIMRSRDYDDEQWSYYSSRLARRGLLDGDGVITDAGRDLKQRIEDTTDLLALSALDGLGDDEVGALFRTLTPITRAVVAAGDVPAATPMGLSRDALDDDNAICPEAVIRVRAIDRTMPIRYGVSTYRHGRSRLMEWVVPFQPADAGAAVGGGDGGPGPRKVADPPVGGCEQHGRVAADVDGGRDVARVQCERGGHR